MKPFFIIACILMCAMSPMTAFALSTSQGISSVIRLDLSSEQIIGDRADYTLSLPGMWSYGHIIADREQPTANSDFLEKIIFSYVPQNKASKPVAFMSFYVYNYHISADPMRPRKILETNLYTFAAESTNFNGFSDKADRDLFDYFLMSAGSDEWIRNLIQVPKTQRIITSDTVTVNSKPLKTPAIQNAYGVVYIPVRETCNAMGYIVNWLDYERTVELVKGDERILLPVTNSQAKQNYSTIIVADRTYVTSIFFMRALNANIEVDSYNNVVISTSPY